MESITELVIDYKRNEIRAKFFPFRPCSPFQKPRTAGSLIPESFFWEWEQVDINKIKYPSNTPNTRPTRISNLATPPPPPKLYSLQVMHGTGQDDSYAWKQDRKTVMRGTGRQLWLEYVRVCVANFPPAIQTPTTFMHIRTSKFFLHGKFSLITFKLTRRSPKDKKKEAYIFTWGRRNQIFERHTKWKKVWGRIIS
jgi:hypothetical protein